MGAVPFPMIALPESSTGSASFQSYLSGEITFGNGRRGNCQINEFSIVEFIRGRCVDAEVLMLRWWGGFDP